MRCGDVDTGSQLVTVIRKGSRAAQQLPASLDAFVWLRLYQAEFHGQVQTRRDDPLWWTLRRPFRGLTYHAARAMFIRVNSNLGTDYSIHDLRHTAAYRMARDPDMPLTDVQWILGHAQLTTTQIYTSAPVEETIASILAHHARRTAAPSAPVAITPQYRSESLNVLFPGGRAVTSTVPASTMMPETSRDQRRHRSDRRDLFELRKLFPPRLNPASWEATEASRGRVLARVLTADNTQYQAEVRRSVRTVLDWLATMPGMTWQARWAASGAEHAADWRILPVTPLAAGRTKIAVSNLQNRCSRGLSVLICADVIRPSLDWLLATPAPKNLATALARSRDPEGFAMLNDQCQRLAVGDGARQIALARVAMIMATKGGRAADITVGDCIEMVQIAAEATKASGRDRGYRSAFFYQLVRTLGRFPGNAPASTRAFHVSGQMSVEEMIDRYRIQCRPIRDLLVDYLREFQVSADYTSQRRLHDRARAVLCPGQAVLA